MIYSERTYEPDAQATVSALKDVIQRQLNAEQLQLHMELIGRANDCSVAARPATCCERRCKSTKLIPLSRPTTQRIPRTCLQGTACGGCQMSNAISRAAGKTEDAERKLKIKQARRTGPQPGMSSIGGAPPPYR